MADTIKMNSFAILGASRPAHDPEEMKLMREIGRSLALNGKTVAVGCMTGQTEQAIIGAYEAGGDVEVFLIPSQQQNSVERCDALGIPYKTVDRDNARTLALLRCDAWISGYLSVGAIGETARGGTWNQDRKIRGRPLTPHFYLDRGRTNKLLVQAYEAAAEEGRADVNLVKGLFIPFKTADGLITRISEMENSQDVSLQVDRGDGSLTSQSSFQEPQRTDRPALRSQ